MVTKKTRAKNDDALQESRNASADTQADEPKPARKPRVIVDTSSLYASREGLITTSLRLTPDIIEKLRVEAFHQRTTKSEIVRRALDAYFAKR